MQIVDVWQEDANEAVLAACSRWVHVFATKQRARWDILAKVSLEYAYSVLTDAGIPQVCGEGQVVLARGPLVRRGDGQGTVSPRMRWLTVRLSVGWIISRDSKPCFWASFSLLLR